MSQSYILFHSRMKSNMDTFESSNNDITYLLYDPSLLTKCQAQWTKQKIKIWKNCISFPGSVRERVCDLGKRKYPFSDFASSFAKQRKQSPTYLLINYLITKCKHCYCLAFIFAICQDFLKFLHEIYNLMQCFSFSCSHVLSEEARQNGEHMGHVNEMLFTLRWIKGNIIKLSKRLPNKLPLKKEQKRRL